MEHYEFTVRIPRRWLRFSLRTTLLLFLLSATFLGGVMVGIRHERKSIFKNSGVATSLMSDIDQLELQLSEVSKIFKRPAPQIEHLEQQIANKKAQLKKLR